MPLRSIGAYINRHRTEYRLTVLFIKYCPEA